MNYVLFYQPPCGKWYVHSHKLYASRVAAGDAARQFLPSGTPISVLPALPEDLEQFMELVP